MLNTIESTQQVDRRKERPGRRIYWTGAAIFFVLLGIDVYKTWYSFFDRETAVISILRLKADGAADKIGQFINEIVSQVGWTTQQPWSVGTMEQRRFDALRLLRQVPAILEIVQLDSTGYEQLQVSRFGMVDERAYPYQKEFAEAVAKKVYFGQVYFRNESEPYMTLALAGTRREFGVSVVEVNLKLIWDVLAQTKVGDKGDAYLVDAQGRLIAHPDISLVLRNTDMSKLTQVQKARQAAEDSPADQEVQAAQDVLGREVLTAYASVPPLGWIVFAELPARETYGPLYGLIERSLALLVVTVAFFGIAWFSRRSRRSASRKTMGPSEVIE